MDIYEMRIYNVDMFWKHSTQRIFLDYAAGTPVSQAALSAFTRATALWGNPQSLHTEALNAARSLAESRKLIAKLFGAPASNITLTSGGTESNNIALAGYLYALEEAGQPLSECSVVVSAIEHPSVLEVLEPFAKKGLTIKRVKPNTHGEVRPESVREVLDDSVVLVSIGMVNSEIGTVQPLHAIAKVIRECEGVQHIAFHTDASQAPLYYSVYPHGLGVDLMTIDSGKMYGPRGIGALYVRNGVVLSPVLRGGSQENGLRPGTENVALAAGFAAACTEALELRESERERIGSIQEKVRNALHTAIPQMVVNGTGKLQSPHILNISVAGIDPEYVVMYLDQRGIALSTKSACLEHSEMQESAVVRALTSSEDAWRASTMMRISFGRETHERDAATIAQRIADAVTVYTSFKS